MHIKLLLAICSYFDFYVYITINWLKIQFKIFKSSTLLQMVLYFSNRFSWSIQKDIYCHFFIAFVFILIFNFEYFNTHISSNITNNDLINLSKYLIKCFDYKYIIKIIISNFYRCFMHHKSFLLLLFSC